jgi:glycerate kinase
MKIKSSDLKPLRILIAPDKFKGTLSASAAAKAIARGWRNARPCDSIELLPISDGGDGFGEVIGELLDAKIQRLKTVDAAHRPCVAHWWWEPKTKTAVIESANVIGLAMLPPKKFHPFELDTFGLGTLICAASNKGAIRCVIGIGGSATNDGGFGLARALGWNFLNRDDVPIEQWTELKKLARVLPPKRRRWFDELIVAVDVQNPLLGPRGATRVYGPQKGLRSQDFEIAEQCLRKLARVFKKDFRKDFSRIPGAGAAGGLGFGLMTFLGAQAKPGFNLFARFAELDERLCAVDLVVTGEGCIDASTFMGKGVGEIARRCRKKKIPCVAFAGNIFACNQVSRVFAEAHALTDFTSLVNAKSKPALWLKKLAEQTARGCPCPKQAKA